MAAKTGIFRRFRKLCILNKQMNGTLFPEAIHMKTFVRISVLVLAAAAAVLSMAVDKPVSCPLEGDPVPGCICTLP